MDTAPQQHPLHHSKAHHAALHIMTGPARHLLTGPFGAWYYARYHDKFHNPKRRFAGDLGLLGIVIGLATVAIYFGLIYKPYDPVNAILTVSPKQLVSGGEAVATLRIENNGKDTLDDVTVAVTVPPNVSITSVSLPFDPKDGTIRYGTIAPHTAVESRLVGSLTGSVGTSHRASAIITYTVRETGLVLHKSQVATLSIESAAISAHFELPEKVIAGAEFSGSIRYRNRSSGPAAHAVITPDWPDGFILSSATPALSGDAWSLGTVAAGAEGVITWHGSVHPNEPTESAAFAAEIGERDGATLLHQGRTDRSVGLIDSHISANVTAETAAGRINERVPVTLSFGNSGTFQGTDAKLYLRTGTDERLIKSIGPLAAGSNGSAPATVTIPRPADAAHAATDVRAVLRFTLDGTEQAAVSIISAPLQIRTATELGLSSAARYWGESGDQLGRGPLPPSVGQPTRIWIFWNVRNTTSAATGVRVSATLPGNVSWTGKASIPYGDPLQFDPASRTLTWNVGAVAAYPGIESPAIGAAFEVVIIPTPDQVGGAASLVSNQIVSGKDTSSELRVSGSAAGLTTNLTADAKARGKGNVQ
jgi:hypothetical protein